MCLFTNWSWVKCELRFHLEGAVEYIAGGKVVVAHSRVGCFVCLALRLKHVCLSLKTLSDNFLTFPLNNSIADCDSQSLRMKPPFFAPFASFSEKHFYSPAEKFSHGKATI